jgi:hypothetical protein
MMCRAIRDLTPLIAIASWLFVALPLIYLNGGPDEMIDKIPTWAPVATSIAATCAAIIAFRAFAVARRQLGIVVQNQKETTAKTNFREFLKLCVEHPDFAYGRILTTDDRPQYEWFVAQFLWAAEEIIEFAPALWEENLRLHISYHGGYLKYDHQFRTQDFQTYSPNLQTFVDAAIENL